MGLRKAYIDFIIDHAGPIRGKHMLEIGNQYVRDDVKTTLKTGKEFWCAAGVNHTSIDINGKDGSLPYNLEKCISELKDRYDIVTDIGTSCYMTNYYQCYDNLYSFCKVNGVVIHILPEVGSKWTATHYIGEIHIESISRIYNCDIVASQIIDTEYGKLRAAALRRLS